jgi:hypothetical protein
MSETAVRVDLRQATLSESARLRETGEQAFLCLENPPPVRSLLRITVGEEQRAFEVGRVIEVVDESEAERGCYGAFVALERLAEQQRVGSEHLQPGIIGAGGSGVPSPVVIMNTNEMLLGEAGSDEEEALAAGMATGGDDDRDVEQAPADAPAPDDSAPDAAEPDASGASKDPGFRHFDGPAESVDSAPSASD